MGVLEEEEVEVTEAMEVGGEEGDAESMEACTTQRGV